MFSKRFYVYVHGENFVFEDEGAKRKGGFYATRFVDAPTLEDAKKRVLDDLWNEPQLKARANAKDDPARMRVEDASEVSWFRSRLFPVREINFFEDDEAD